MKIKAFIIILFFAIYSVQVSAISRQLKNDIKESKHILIALQRNPNKFKRNSAHSTLEINRIEAFLKTTSEDAALEDAIDEETEVKVINLTQDILDSLRTIKRNSHKKNTEDEEIVEASASELFDIYEEIK